MGHVSYTELRQNLKKYLDSVSESRAPRGNMANPS